MYDTLKKPGWLQHKVRPEVKAWIEQEAKAQERSQTWFVNKLVEDAYSRAKPAIVTASQQPVGAQP